MKPTHPVQISRMNGFTLIQALVSLIIFASITVSALNWQRFNLNVDVGRNLGQQYLTLNAAVNNYMVNYYQSLSALNPACSEMTFTTINPASPPTTQRANANCSMTVVGRTVANGLQPSPADLIALGLLTASPTVASTNLLQIESPNIPTTQVVYEYMPSVVPSHSGPSQPRLFINIEMLCIQRGTASNPNNGNAAPTTPGPTGCPSATTTTALRSLIFNTQPYNNNKNSYSFTFPALLGSAFTTMGDDAVSSGMTDVKLANSGSAMKSKNFQLANPIAGGPSGIMGLLGGYGASYAMQHSRVDGSNPPTANWDFGAHDLNNVNNLNVSTKISANTIDATSRLKIPPQNAGSVCKSTLESIAIDQNGDLLVCKNNIWSNSLASGTVDFSRYYELLVEGNVDSQQTFFMTDCYTDKGSCHITGNLFIGNCVYSRSDTQCNLHVKLPVKGFIPLIRSYQSGNPNHQSNKNDDLGYAFGDFGDGNYNVTVYHIWYTTFSVRFYPIIP